MAFILASQTLIDPNEFIAPPIQVGEIDYACDGSLKSDMVAVKTEFYLSWLYLTSTEYAVLDTLYRASAAISFQYPDDLGVQQTVTVWITKLDPGARILPTLYEGVELELREV